mgnify:CR=1 FL=1
MSIWNKILAALATSVLFAAPAFADGTPGKHVNKGPAPVVAHQPTPPEPGCYLIEDGKAWSCPARPTHEPRPAPVVHKQSTHDPCCGTFKRTIVKEHPPVITKRTVTHRSAPITRTVTRQPVRSVRVVEHNQGIHLDLASFNGGVGNGADGGCYGGGGGAIIITGGQRFSGVLSHPASRFTFRNRGGGKKRHGGGCGKCMGGAH